MIKRKCVICNTNFNTYQSRIKIGKGKFCSKICKNKSLIGKIPWNKGILRPDFSGKNHPMFGKHHSEKTRKKWSKIRKGKNLGNAWGFKKGMITWNKGLKLPQFSNENNPLWKGDKVSYTGLHKWVYRHRGKALKCEFCGKEKTTPRSINWANKSHKYLRDLNDWISLCVSCHRKYDTK